MRIVNNIFILLFFYGSIIFFHLYTINKKKTILNMIAVVKEENKALESKIKILKISVQKEKRKIMKEENNFDLTIPSIKNIIYI